MLSLNPSDPLPVPLGVCLGGLDPSGGAGILRDAITLAALDVFPMAVPTAETLQNGASCLQIEGPSMSPMLRLEALAPHLIGLWGVKLGLCAMDEHALRALGDLIEEYQPFCRIWDPIQAPTSGTSLHTSGALRRMAGALLRHSGWVVSPNRQEAGAVSQHPPEADPRTLCKPWLELGAEAVWLKGGHDSGDEVEDFWVTPAEVKSLGRCPRLPGERRGTGCTLAAAWLGFRLHGHDGASSARMAASWLRSYWDAAVTPGGFGRPAFFPGIHR